MSNVFNQIIDNAKKTNKLTHAYLLSAPKHYKIESEYLYLIKTILDNDEINLKTYSDLITIDGSEGLIKKEQVTSAINKMSETALDKSGMKILLLLNIENGNGASLNSLLKFIEEPTKKTYIIMTTNNVGSVLTTIKSRAQVISIVPKSKQEIASELLKKGIPHTMAHIASKIATSSSDALKLAKNETFKKLVDSIIEAFKLSIHNRAFLRTNLSSIITKKNYQEALGVLKVLINDIWRNEINLDITFVHEKDSIEALALAEFDYRRALLSIDDFFVNQSSNVNFDLHKNKMILELEASYV